MSESKQLRLQDFLTESYGSLAAKLSYICKVNFEADVDIRIIVAISDQDSGRGSAILKLTRQFGIFPIELSNSKGEFDLQELSELTSFSGLTLIIQSFPIDALEMIKGEITPPLLNSISGVFDKADSLKAHIPVPSGIVSDLSQDSVDMLLHQAMVLSQYFTQHNNDMTGPIIYLTGFSIKSAISHTNDLRESRIIPWYLLIEDKKSLRRVYRQPELENFLQFTAEEAPRIYDLEEHISEMDREE